MFPFNIDIDEDGGEEEADKEPCEYGIDFSTGQLTGKKVYGLEAIKVWIYLALGTPRYRMEHHSWDYGHELEELIGLTPDEDYIMSTAKCMIEECLQQNKHILGISDFIGRIEDDNLICTFTVETDLGDVEGVEADV